MKRFYCQVCRKLKRVQKLPYNVVNPHATLPGERVGSCNRHISGKSHQSFNNQVGK